MLKTFKNIFSLILDIFSQIYIKFTAFSISFLYAHYIGTFVVPYTVVLISPWPVQKGEKDTATEDFEFYISYL